MPRGIAFFESAAPLCFEVGLARQVTLAVMQRLVHDIVLVTDDEIRESMRLILTATHNLPEPAGAATTAAAWKLRAQMAGKKVVGILSGGNCDLRVLAEIGRCT